MKRIGTQLKLTEDDRSRLIADLNFWRDKSEEYFERRERLEKAFYCVWPGAHPSGLVLDTEEEAAWPFDGASDQRVRLADEIFKELDAIICVALAAATVEIRTSGADKEKRASSILVLLKWMLDTMGAEGWMQIKAMIHYFMCDTPAIAGITVDWRKNYTFHPIETDAEEVVAEFATAMATTGMMSEVEATETAWNIIGSVGDEGWEPGPLMSFLIESKGARERDAVKIVKALGTDDGRVEFLTRGDPDEGINLTALRYGDDFCIPIATTNFKYANPWFRGEWVTKTQLEERIVTDGYDPKWVEETLQHGGSDFYNDRDQHPWADEDLKDLYNICWCYTTETSETGETIRYVTLLSHAEGSAFGKRVLGTRRGKWNTVIFRREVLSTNIVEGRGIAEIASADQGIIKTLNDRSNDNAIIGSLPPVTAKGTQARNAVVEPFGKIPMGTADDVKFMTPPQFPATAKDRAKEIRDALREYMGLPTEKSQDTTKIKSFVRDVLVQFQELYTIMIETAQDCASDEILASVTDDGDVKGLKREDITGKFGMKLVLDADNIDGEKLMKKLTTFSQILGMDKNHEVDTSPVLAHALTTMFPEISKRLIRPPDALLANDLKDEQENFVKIKAGVMPQMNTEGGWNYGARLQWWNQLQKENPDTIAEMSPRSQEMMQQWLAALQQQETQYGKNAEIGKTGVQGVGSEE